MSRTDSSETRAMQRRRLGRTDLELSVVGFGTCQLRNVPEPQAIDTLVRGFELGVNWVHVAPDYGGAEAIVAKAIAVSGREVAVLSNGYGEVSHFRWLFDQTRRILGQDRLPAWGISCIDDAERVGWDVWGKDGMVATLQELKQQGRIGATFCTTHGAPDYIEKLIRSRAFDGIMLSYNPLGFHVLSFHAASVGHGYESLEANRQRIFPLALEHGVGLLIMKPLAGGLLARSLAFPPKQEFATTAARPTVTAILQHILGQPGVTAVCPGTAAPAEAEENAKAGWVPHLRTVSEEMQLAVAVGEMRATLCSRCGACETTCSRDLPVSWLFREAYMWNTHGDSFESNTRQHYFHLHPQDRITCAVCTEQTCVCPTGLDIPNELARVHASMLARRAEGWLPATPEKMSAPPLAGSWPARVVWSDVPAHATAGRLTQFRFWVENAGPGWWLVDKPVHETHRGEPVSLAMFAGGHKLHEERVRHDVEPHQRTHFAFELRAPDAHTSALLTFALVPRGAVALPATATVLMQRGITVDTGPQAEAQEVPQPAFPRVRVPTIHRPPPVAAPVAEPRYGVTFLAHNLPAEATAGVVLGVMVRLRNDSSFPWRPLVPSGRCVDLAALLDGTCVNTVKLPRDIGPGEEVAVRFALTLPLQAGRHEIVLHMVEQQVAVFADRGGAALFHAIDLCPATPGDRNAELWSILRQTDPWHYLPTQGVSQLDDGSKLPVFARSARGCHVTDAAGREYLDYTMGWGTTLLGYAHPEVVAALHAAATSGLTLAWPTELEMEVAAMLTQDIPCAEMVVFGKNGTDACTVAVRMSRAFTGRKKVLYCGYHGFGDWFAQQRGFRDSGVPPHPEQLVHSFRFLDLEDFHRLLALHRDDLACVMLEPSGPWGGNDRGFEPDCTREFLQAIAAATRASGALLVFDEIITGYRYPGHSVQAAHGVVPDLACLGKALASGMPLSAVVGRRDVFTEALPRCHYGPTFKGEMLSFAAAKASITVCRREPVARHCWDYGERLRAGIHGICEQMGLDAKLTGPPFRMSLLLGEQDRFRRVQLRTLLQQEMLRAGLSTVNGVMLPCWAHDDNALAETLRMFERAAGVVTDAAARGRLEEALRIPPLIDL